MSTGLLQYFSLQAALRGHCICARTSRGLTLRAARSGSDRGVATSDQDLALAVGRQQAFRSVLSAFPRHTLLHPLECEPTKGYDCDLPRGNEMLRTITDIENRGCRLKGRQCAGGRRDARLGDWTL